MSRRSSIAPVDAEGHAGYGPSAGGSPPMSSASATASSPRRRSRARSAVGCALDPRHLGSLAVDVAKRQVKPVHRGVFAVGDGASVAGAAAAMAQGELAGMAAAAELGFACDAAATCMAAETSARPRRAFPRGAVVAVPSTAGLARSPSRRDHDLPLRKPRTRRPSKADDRRRGRKPRRPEAPPSPRHGPLPGTLLPAGRRPSAHEKVGPVVAGRPPRVCR